MKQKFHQGDLVFIKEDLGPYMSHFESGCRAIVQYSYNDRYGDKDKSKEFKNESDISYSLWLEGRGSVAWYHQDQLILIEAGRGDLLERWEKEEEEKKVRESDLDYIFSIKDPNQLGYYSLQALADVMELGSLWGSRGEGVDLVRNQHCMRILFSRFVSCENPKEEFLKAVAEFKEKVRADKIDTQI